MKSNNIISWETIDSIEKLVAIKVEWEEFYLNNSIDIPFINITWLTIWIKYYWQKNWQLKVLIGRSNDSIFTIMPMYIQIDKSIFSKSTMYPIGIGEPELKEVSTEYLDIIIKPEFEELTLKKIKKWILDLKVDEIIWRGILQNSNVLNLFQSFDQTLRKPNATRYIVHIQSWSVKKLSKNMRSRYRRGLNQLSKLDAEIKWIKKEDINQYWQIMKDFHQSRWLGRSNTGALCSEEFNQFHTELRRQSPENIAMSAIWVNGIPIALHYYFMDSSTLYFYQSGWNENEYAHLSPGLLLHLWGIENTDKLYYDFMMGKKCDSYKAKFSPHQQSMHNVNFIFNPIKVNTYQVIKKLNTYFYNS